LSLLGLLRHLAKVEHSWFQRVPPGQTQILQLYWSEQDRDLAFSAAVPDPVVVEDAWQAWRREVEHAQAYLDSVADLGAMVDHRGQETEIGDIIVHMVEEYPRRPRRPRRPAPRVHRRANRPVRKRGRCQRPARSTTPR
jgi:uncharacterized damage-inducible protein DinB